MKKSPLFCGIRTFIIIGIIWQMLKILFSESLEVTLSEVVILLLFAASAFIYKVLSNDYNEKINPEDEIMTQVISYESFTLFFAGLTVASVIFWRLLEIITGEGVHEVPSDTLIGLILGVYLAISVVMYKLWKRDIQDTVDELQEHTMIIDGTPKKVIDVDFKKVK